MVSELRSRWTSGDEVTGAGPASSRRAAVSSRRRIESERDEMTATASGGSGVGLGLGIEGAGRGAAYIRSRGRRLRGLGCLRPASLAVGGTGPLTGPPLSSGRARAVPRA